MGLPADSCINRKQQALVLLLARQIADAQFQRGDAAQSERLWQEVAALEIDPERVTALLFSGIDPEDRDALRAEDEAWLGRQAAQRRRGWTLQQLHRNRSRAPRPAFSRA